MTTADPPGVIAIWNDIVPAARADFLEWHTREHIPERVGVPGFLRGRRAFAAQARPQYLTLYDVTSVDVLTSAPYLTRLNAPTPWTQRAVAQFRNAQRAACRVVKRAGHGAGGTIGTLRVWLGDGADADVAATALARATEAVVETPGVCCAVLGASDSAATGVKTAEKSLRPPDQIPPDFAVIVEAFAAQLDEAAFIALLNERFMSAAGGCRTQTDVYALEFALGNAP
jgi:hypothetical protein